MYIDYEQLEKLGVDIMLCARAEKKVAQPAFEKFTNILLQMGEEFKGKDNLPRNIAGLLFFIYMSLESEAEHCSYTDDLFLAVGQLQELLEKIYWDSPFEER